MKKLWTLSRTGHQSPVHFVIANGRQISQVKPYSLLSREGLLAGEVARNLKGLICKAAEWAVSRLPCHRGWGRAERTPQSSEEALTGRPSCPCRWIPTCVQLFASRKEQWVRFAPKSDHDSSHNIEEYFAAVASFMSLQLRKLVIKSLKALVSFFMIYEVCRGPEGGPF